VKVLDNDGRLTGGRGETGEGDSQRTSSDHGLVNAGLSEMALSLTVKEVKKKGREKRKTAYFLIE
jgi:hypothetical protein